jgi:hypothetical protein
MAFHPDRIATGIPPSTILVRLPKCVIMTLFVE